MTVEEQGRVTDVIRSIPSGGREMASIVDAVTREMSP